MAGEAMRRRELLDVGKRVTVKGTLFGAHTMWHVEDVLIDATSVRTQVARLEMACRLPPARIPL